VFQKLVEKFVVCSYFWLLSFLAAKPAEKQEQLGPKSMSELCLIYVADSNRGWWEAADA
jgi:hypothetical protein